MSRGIVETRSPVPFDETLERLRAAFAERGLRIFAQIDQQEAAREAGLDMPPTTLILFGNPRAGTPLMIANPASGLDLPLKALVTEREPGEVWVSMNTASYLIERHELPTALAANLAPAEALVAAVLRP
ncbi:MAG TPA: DUF302 domain-containing protein [Usitatibacter sp.]|jgi:uncharacterized protein (DUF302 family)|nr:DUF302 domain-containing protein [Usitatibacter sp.]